MRKLNSYSISSPVLSNPSGSLTAIYFIVILGCLVSDKVVRAQGAAPPQSSQASPNAVDAPIAVSSIVNAYAKGQEESHKVVEEIGIEQGKKQALVVKKQQQETERDTRDHKARLFDDSPESQRMKKDLANYNATCTSAGMPKTVYGADIARCTSAAASIGPRLNYHNNTMNNYFTQFNASQQQIQAITNEIVLVDARITKLQNYLSWLTDTNNKISTTLHQDCEGLDSNPTIEELKHRCGNIQFDNARVKLPPCDTDSRCQSWVIYTRPSRSPEQAIQDYKNSGAASPTHNPGLDRANVPSPTGIQK
jgi:hypothetical protein